MRVAAALPFRDMRGSAVDDPGLEEVTAAFLFCPLFGQAANRPRMRPDEADHPRSGPARQGGRNLRNQLARCLTRPAAGDQPTTPRHLCFCFEGGDGQVAGWRAVKVA